VRILTVADVHLGNRWCNYVILEQIMKRFLAKRTSSNGRYFIAIGDLIDGTNMYELQKLYQLPSARDAMRALILWFNDLIPEDMERVLVLGNHEDNAEGIELTDFLEKLGWKIYRGYFKIVHNDKTVCFVHSSLKSARGSKTVSITPQLQFFNVLLAKELGCDVFVSGHIHKSFSMMLANGIIFVTLPSFTITPNSMGEQIYYTPTMFQIDLYELWFRPYFIKIRGEDLDKLLRENYKKMLEIVEKYIDRVMPSSGSVQVKSDQVKPETEPVFEW